MLILTVETIWDIQALKNIFFTKKPIFQKILLKVFVVIAQEPKNFRFGWCPCPNSYHMVYFGSCWQGWTVRQTGTVHSDGQERSVIFQLNAASGSPFAFVVVPYQCRILVQHCVCFWPFVSEKFICVKGNFPKMWYKTVKNFWLGSLWNFVCKKKIFNWRCYGISQGRWKNLPENLTSKRKFCYSRFFELAWSIFWVKKFFSSKNQKTLW